MRNRITYTTKDEVWELIMQSDKPIGFKFEDLQFSFGFKRIPGEEFLLIKLLKPSATEESLSYLPVTQIHDNIKSWCTENHILFNYDITRDTYYFKSWAAK